MGIFTAISSLLFLKVYCLKIDSVLRKYCFSGILQHSLENIHQFSMKASTETEQKGILIQANKTLVNKTKKKQIGM